MAVESTPKHRSWEDTGISQCWKQLQLSIATLSHWIKRNSFTPECLPRAPTWTPKSPTWILCDTSRLSYLYSTSPPPPKQHPHLESTFDLGNGSKTTVITPISQSQLLIWFTRPLNPGSWNPASHQHELQYVGLPSYWQGSRHFCHLTRCTQIFNSCIITSELRTYEDLIGKIKSYSTWYTWEVFVSERLSVTAINWQARIRRSNPAFFPRGYTALGSWRSIPSDRPSLSPEDCLTRVILR